MEVMTNPISLNGFIDSSCIEQLLHMEVTEERCDIDISLSMQCATYEISGLTVQLNNNLLTYLFIYSLTHSLHTPQSFLRANWFEAS
jgi:hypothetical protein